MPPDSGRTSHKSLLAVLVSLAVLVPAVHWPALTAKAVLFDDSQYLLDNELMRRPGWAAAGRFLSEVRRPSTVDGYYQPLTMISLMLDAAAGAGRDNLTPVHRTSLLLHTANTILAAVLLYQLFGVPWAAGIVALLFGCHPLTVEPVAWISERKTLLATLFALGSLMAYVRHSRRPTAPAWIASLLLYALALLSKPTSTPLPVLMVLLDIWPLNRWSRRRLIEKWPFFVLGTVSSAVTVISQSGTAAIVTPGVDMLPRIPLMVCHNIAFYAINIVCPVNLAPYYPFPAKWSPSDPAILIGLAGTAALITLVWISLHWTRAALIGGLIFLAALAPTLNIIGFTFVVAADKYLYLPSIGLLILLASWLSLRWTAAARENRQKRWIMTVIVLTVVMAEVAGSRRQWGLWADSDTLLEHMLAVAPGAAPVQAAMGALELSRGNIDQAIGWYQEAISHRPDFAVGHQQLATALLLAGRSQEAIHHLNRVISIHPRYARAHMQLGVAYYEQRDAQAALRSFQRALELGLVDPQLHNNLGAALAETGELQEAAAQYRRALQLKPDHVEAMNNLGIALIRSGKTDDAIAAFERVIQMRPDHADAHAALGGALLRREQFAQAMEHYRAAIRLGNQSPLVHNNLGVLLARQKRFAEALPHFEMAVQLAPDYIDAQVSLNATRRALGLTTLPAPVGTTSTSAAD